MAINLTRLPIAAHTTRLIDDHVGAGARAARTGHKAPSESPLPAPRAPIAPYVVGFVGNGLALAAMGAVLVKSLKD